jgi:hypothetical protein
MPGHENDGYNRDRSWPTPPRHCRECGHPFPWTRRKAEALIEVIEELDELTPEERQKLHQSVPDIIADTPKSETAVVRFKKAAKKTGEVGGKLLLGVLSNVATEAVKKTLGLTSH